MALKVNYKDDIFSGNRKYRMITNSDGTISLEDVTTYIQTGDTFASQDINTTNSAINTLDSSKVTPQERADWNSKAAGNHNHDGRYAPAVIWIARAVLPTDYPGVEFKLDIPNFVFTEGCSVTFKPPFKLKEDSNSLVRINDIGYALRTPQGKMVSGNAWAVNSTVTVILSTQKFPVRPSSGDERQGTAFYSGELNPIIYVQESAPSYPATNDLWLW